MTEQQTQMEVRAVKLKRKGDEGFIPEIIVHDPELKLNRTYSDCENLCHADFTKAVGRLNHHIAILIDKIPNDKFEDDEKVDEIMVARGFSLSGNEDELRVTLKGYQKTSRGGAFQINTPVVYLQTKDENKAYYFIDDLKEKLKRIAMEARLYIFSAKKFEDPQLSLNMPGDPITKAKIVEPVTPESIVGDIVNTVNGTPPVSREKKKRVPQSAQHKDGQA